MQIVRAARDYALKLPRANGKSGAIGFCLGGSIAWQGAADMPGLNAAVSFYGGPPDLATMAKIQAPVYAFDGDADLGTFSKMVASAPDMKRLGKDFEFKVYPGATHAFLYQQQLAQNAPATLDSWPKAMAFFKKYLS
jgi:carboxymethylenebutenolidase